MKTFKVFMNLTQMLAGVALIFFAIHYANQGNYPHAIFDLLIGGYAIEAARSRD